MWWRTLRLTAALIACHFATAQTDAVVFAKNIPDVLVPFEHLPTSDNPNPTDNTERLFTVNDAVTGYSSGSPQSRSDSSSENPADNGSNKPISGENGAIVGPRSSEENTSDGKGDGSSSPEDSEHIPPQSPEEVKSSSESTGPDESGDNGNPPITEPEEDKPEEIPGSVEKSAESVQPDEEIFIVETKSGKIQGHVWQDTNIISFYDIPYGRIENHFQAAAPAEAWALHNEKDHQKRCPQLEDDKPVGDIDCLTLSIYKSRIAKNAGVLFHIHAENFNTGSGDPSIYGPNYLVSPEIILVLPNYRLGPYGFLCMQNETAPGNMALKDLSLALSWIKDNIEAFGGDPSNIAVSGEGRSGALAGLLALSPMSMDHISKVIAESGSFLSYWALDRDPTATATELLDKIQEQNGQSRIDISLSEIPIETILTAAKGLELRPCLETGNVSAFMTASPFKTVTTRNFNNKTTFLLGSAMYAGVHEALLQTEDSIRALNANFALLLPDDLAFSTAAMRNEVAERVKKQYFGEAAIRLADVKELSLCFTDVGYLSPGLRSARLLAAAGATVYFYEFAYVGALNRVLLSVNSPVDGAVRGDIIGYLFTQDGHEPGEDQAEENKMVESLTKMWSTFLETGTPATEEIEWKSLDNEAKEAEEAWLLIGEKLSTEKGIHVKRMPLWTEIYQKHFIEVNRSHELSASVYTVLVFQLIFWFSFCRNASHIY